MAFEVPVSVGADVKNIRPTLDELELSMPRLTPLTSTVGLPTVWVRLAAVRAATFVPPNCTLTMEVGAKADVAVMAPMVSAELAASEPLYMNFPPLSWIA